MVAGAVTTWALRGSGAAIRNGCGAEGSWRDGWVVSAGDRYSLG